jgi:hypothetical protein
MSDRRGSCDVPCQPFRSRDAHRFGLTPKVLRGPRVRRVFTDVYVSADAPDTLELRARALALASAPDAAFTGRTSALLRGLPVRDDGRLHVIVPGGRTVPDRRDGVSPHEGLREADVVDLHGLRVLDAATTWVALAAELRREDLVVLGEAVLSEGWARPEQLAVAVTAAAGRRGVVLARACLPLLRDRVDSPQETRTRLTLVDGGLPCPVVNPDVLDDWGEWIGRPDLAYLDLKVAIQYEGDVHRTNRRRWMQDVGRDAVLEDHGWVVIRVTADDLRRPDLLVARVARRMAQQRRRPS